MRVHPIEGVAAGVSSGVGVGEGVGEGGSDGEVAGTSLGEASGVATDARGLGDGPTRIAVDGVTGVLSQPRTTTVASTMAASGPRGRMKPSDVLDPRTRLGQSQGPPSVDGAAAGRSIPPLADD